MAVAVQMPKQGNTVEECLLVEWRVAEGDMVAVGDALCSIETDKASFEVESTAEGTVLKLLAKAGDLVPVLTDIVVVGQPGEALDSISAPQAAEKAAPQEEAVAVVATPVEEEEKAAVRVETAAGDFKPVSPRARALAGRLGVDAAAIPGSGAAGRVTSRDVKAAVDNGSAVKASPLAKAIMADTGDRPLAASGIGGLALSRDLGRPAAVAAPEPEAPEAVAYQGIRKLIGERMRESLANTAQLTLNASARADGLLAARKIFKENAKEAGLPDISINDLVCWVVARTLASFPEINACFDRAGAVINRHKNVNLAFAVDTPRGLMVPVVTDAARRTLADLAALLVERAAACRQGNINPDFLSGGTFTVTNLGGMGIESFTPVLNPPQVGILGVCAITKTAVPGADGGVVFEPRIGLSLTFDHQAVDGAPAARFLQAVAKGIESVQAALALYGAVWPAVGTRS